MGNRTRVLNHLENYGSLTSAEAFKLYGETRLSAVVFDLKKMGNEIESIRESGVNRYGEPTHFVRYYLKKR